jgi:Flp pilus assembly protein TadD
VFLKMGGLDEAERDYLRAIELSPLYAEMWVNLGQCYRATDRMAVAVRAWHPAGIHSVRCRVPSRTPVGGEELPFRD